MSGGVEIKGVVKTMPSHAQLPFDSNRNRRKQESLQLIQNKRSRPFLIATFRGSFQVILCVGRVTRPESLFLAYHPDARRQRER
jgi:hypothetical protein